MKSTEISHSIRSYVRRSKHITDAQKKALEKYWPIYGIEYSLKTIDFSEHFVNSNPIILEIGFGMGDSLLLLAQQNPSNNYLGIEVHRQGIGRLLAEIARLQLKNIRIICYDAVTVLQQIIRDNSLAGVLVFFPDPWPKQRHHKRRLIQHNFVNLLARKIQNSGFLHMATDWQDYAEHMLTVMQHNNYFVNHMKDNSYAPRPSTRPITKFEKRGQRLGHTIFDLIYLRNTLIVNDEAYANYS